MKRQRNTFLTPLVVEVMESGRRFKLHYEFTYVWRYPPRERLGAGPLRITVPAGFVTDFASVPRIFRIIIPKLGKYNKAAVIHDYTYQMHEVNVSPMIIQGFSRKQADQCFRDGMRDLGVAKWKINIMYQGLRMFGWMAWRKR